MAAFEESCASVHAGHTCTRAVDHRGYHMDLISGDCWTDLEEEPPDAN
jgi:hypothetical protein